MRCGGSQEVAKRWLKASRALSKEDQIRARWAGRDDQNAFQRGFLRPGRPPGGGGLLLLLLLLRADSRLEPEVRLVHPREFPRRKKARPLVEAPWHLEDWRRVLDGLHL